VSNFSAVATTDSIKIRAECLERFRSNKLRIWFQIVPEMEWLNRPVSKLHVTPSHVQQSVLAFHGSSSLV
jgi:hypothetical protein